MTTQEAIDIGKANEVLKQAYELVNKAYDLIFNNPVAKEHLNFNCAIGWNNKTWNKLNEEYDKMPMSNERYYLRAFNYFKLQHGSCISLNGMNQTTGG